jgi:serine/threonine protein kinase
MAPQEQAPARGSDGVVHFDGALAVKTFASGDLWRREAEHLRRLTHPSIVKLHEVLEDPPIFSITLPRYDIDLLHLLMSPKKLGPTTSPSLCGVITCVLRAVSACERAGVAHCDVKPENFLLRSPFDTSETSSDIVLCDFARAVPLPSQGELTNMTFRGTRTYAAPEWRGGVVSRTTDAWSAGCVLFCILERDMPFDEEGYDPTEGVPELSSQHNQRFVHDLLEPDHLRRSSAGDALRRHPF